MLTWTIGDIAVTSVAEFEVPIPADAILIGAETDALLAHDWLRGWAVTDEGFIVLRIQALIVDTGERRIVVDTCVGNDKDRDHVFFNHINGPFLAEMAAAGYPRETVDTVVCTHLHLDHVGWNTMRVEGRWVPTFPNARYLFCRTEVEAEAEIEGGADVWGDSVQPIFDAGLADLVAPDHEIAPGIRLLPTHGHTPGHVSVAIDSGGASAVITGDVTHHPIQIAQPDIGSAFDADTATAEKTRRAFLDEYAGVDVLVIGTHFATPGAGHIERTPESYRFRV
jgi:glyoxylase-like metal-dependent hydrolase (beta-lactamase superfamily II)